MQRNPRRKVVHFEIRANGGPSKHLFPECVRAVLECGHVVNLGVSSCRPQRMACHECGLSQERPPHPPALPRWAGKGAERSRSILGGRGEEPYPCPSR